MADASPESEPARSPARRVLDAIYRASLVLSGFFLVVIGAIVVAQIGGRWVGLLVPSADEFAGFAMAACFFLALPYTLRSGGHIRVAFLTDRLADKPRRWFETGAAGLGALIAAYYAWYAFDMVRSSFLFGDMSFGMLPVPLWVPQSGFALGLAGLTLALIDETIEIACGRRSLATAEST